MKNGLIILAATFIPLTVGCATLSGRKFPEGMISGIEYATLNQNRVPYKLEEHVIYNERQYFYKREKNPQTLPFEILDYKDITRELDLDSKKIRLQSDKKYIPVKVESEKGEKDRWVDGIVMRTNGPYGLKAYMLNDEQLKEMAKGPKNSYGYKVITTEDGTAFAIKTKKILGEEYFFPLVENERMNEKGKKNFYLIPVKNAKIRIDDKCGNMSIYNENKVYRPTDPKVFPELSKETKHKIQTKKITIN